MEGKTLFMEEVPFFFDSGGRRLYGVLHRPVMPTGLGYVFCHPLAEEKLWTHRIYVSFARELAQRGIAVLRFDETGHGDSEGSYADTDVDSRIADIAAAMDVLKAEAPAVERVGLLGLRFGATLAWLAASAREDVEELVLWEPVTDGGKYMQEVLLRNLSTQMAAYGKVKVNREGLVERLRAGESINSDGYAIGPQLFEQTVGVQLLERSAPRCDALVVHIAPTAGKAPPPSFEALAAASPRGHFVQVVEQPFWREVKRYYGRAEALFRDTLNWLEAAHA